MNKYELLLIIRAGLEEEKREALVAKINGFLESSKANVTKVDKWGIKKLAYPINYQNEGYYVIFEMEAPATLVAEVEPRLRIEEEVIRVLFIAK
ncbi:MAG: 30S ribosomal protein S6 [Spirochaetales bacterium]